MRQLRIEDIQVHDERKYDKPEQQWKRARAARLSLCECGTLIVTLATNAQTTRLLFDGTRCVGVEWPTGSAHADQIVLCGGTIARFVRDGHEVVMCHATVGDMGSFVHTREEISGIRLREAKRAAEIAGAAHGTLRPGRGEVGPRDPAPSPRVRVESGSSRESRWWVSFADRL